MMALHADGTSCREGTRSVPPDYTPCCSIFDGHTMICEYDIRYEWWPTARHWAIVIAEAAGGEETAGIEPLPFASEHVGETIILKHTFHGFQTPELEQYLHQRGKRFVLTAGLLTSTCVLLTTASAMQKGFLVALVEDCCADEPNAHKHTLERY